MNVWLNIAAFQIGWFVCVLGAARGMPGLGIAVGLVIVAMHLRRVPQPRSESLLLLVAAVVGIVADTLLIRGNWLAFDSGTIIPGVTPYWMIALWIIFATTLNVSLGWLKRRRLLAAALGAVGGPLAYYAGAELGAVTIAHPPTALAAVGVVWALAMPLLLYAADRYNGTIRPASPSGVRCV